MVKKLHIKEAVEIEVKNTGVLEVPEDKNVDELPIKHFVALANKKGLSTVTKALNNLQVWNKNKDPKLSKWAGDMIDKVTKRVENQKNESLNYMKEHVYDSIVNLPEKEFIDKLAFQVSTCYDPTSERMIVHNLEKSRDAAIDCLEFLLPNYKVSDIIDTIHQRSENISTTNDPHEFENYFYDKVMNKTLDYVIKNEKVSSQYHISYESINHSIRRTCAKESNQDKIDYRLECADYAMYKVVTNHTGIELISDNTNGKYEVDYNGVTVTVEFDLDGIAKYEYTINGKGPYCHDSYEYITNDIRNYVDEILDNEEDIDESCTLTEFSSNFDGTEFDEVEFYSKDLGDYPEYQIKSAIEAGCTFPINIYDVTYEWGGNIVISYEVKEEDYNPDNIEQEIIAVLERLEDRIRG